MRNKKNKGVLHQIENNTLTPSLMPPMDEERVKQILEQFMGESNIGLKVIELPTAGGEYLEGFDRLMKEELENAKK